MLWRKANWATLCKKDLGNGSKPVDLNSGHKANICIPTPITRDKHLRLKLNCIKKRGIKPGMNVKVPGGEIFEVLGIRQEKGELVLKDFNYTVNPLSVEIIQDVA